MAIVIFAVLLPPVVPAIVTEAVLGAPDTNWKVPLPLPCPRIIVLALIVLTPAPKLIVQVPAFEVVLLITN